MDIIDWVEDNSASSILWLRGPAGAGKSAIAQTIAQYCKENGLLVASHFFSRTLSSSERSDGDRVVPTLTLQPLQAFPVMQQHIEGVIHKDPGIFHRQRSIQMEELFIKPWRCRRITRLHFMRRLLFQFRRYIGIPQAYSGRLIDIDGLDECSDPEVQCDLLHITSACARIPRLLRFLIASRPEIHIEQTFGSETFELNPVKRINLADDPDANWAIRRYLLREFNNIRKNNRAGANFHPTEDMITKLVEKSSGQFIYPSTVIKYIQHPRDNPGVRLEVIMGISPPRVNDRPFAQLDALYTHIFSSAYGFMNDAIKSIFGIIFLASQQHYYYLEPSPAFLASVLGLKIHEITFLLDDFVSLVALPQDPAQHIRLFHASLFDFLCNQERSGVFALDLPAAHEAVATHFSRLLNVNHFDAVTIYRRLLLHLKEARPSKQYLLSSRILIERFIHIIKKSPSAVIKMASVFDRFFDILSTKGWETREDPHYYAKDISERLAGIVRIWDPSFEYDALFNPFKSPTYAAKYCVYRILEFISIHRGYRSVEVLQEVVYYTYTGRTDDTDFLKYHIVILFPQLSAEAIERCTQCASLVGSLTDGNELDDLVRQTVLAYLNRVENPVDGTSLRFKATWGKSLRSRYIVTA